MTRDELLALQWEKLEAGLDVTFERNAFYGDKFRDAGLARADLRSLEDFSRLPFTTKDELLDDQQQHPPYGSNLAFPLIDYLRLHQTSGTTTGRRLRWLDTAESWSWILDCWDEIYEAVGLTPSDRLFFPFSFGPFLGFWAGFDGAVRRGHFSLPGGGMSTVGRLELIDANRITIVLATPTYALRMAEVAATEGIDLASGSVRGLILAGEPGACIPSTRGQLEQAWGARVYDHSGMTEIGSLGVEYDEFPGKLFLLEDQCIAEFLDPQTGEPVGEGELGELVLTNLGRWGSPLFRYRTGDLVRWRDDVCPAGRPFRYLDGGILGRADDMLWIKGNNVYPSAIEGVLREDQEICEYEIIARKQASGTTLEIVLEPYPNVDRASLGERITTALRNRLSFKPALSFAEPQALPRYEMKARRFRLVSDD